MKKIICAVFVIVMSAVVCPAQWFIGGSVGIYDHSDKSSDKTNADNWSENDGTYMLRLGVNPKVGYIFNDWISAGLSLGYSYDKMKRYEDGVNYSRQHMNYITVSPFLRTVCWQKGRFAFALETMAGIGFGNGKVYLSRNNTEFTDKVKAKLFNAGIAPLAQLNLSSKITLETRLNFLSLGYNYNKTEYEVDGDVISKNKTSSFRFGYDSDNLFTTGDLTIGFIYKF